MKNVCGYPLRFCVWEITLACCFSCRYCGSKAGKARKNELTTEECLNVARQLADMGCQRVSLIGGEVFMRPDWPEIVQALTKRNVAVSIITNGYLFSQKIISQLKRVRVESVAISLDGPESVHDSYRQTGSFQRAIRAMDVLLQHHIPVAVISTLHSENIDHLQEIYEVLRDRNIYAWQLQACSPMGNVPEGGVSEDIDFRKVIAFVEKHAGRERFAVGVADNIGYFSESEGRLRGNVSGKAAFRGCTAGLTNIGIDSVGNVRGCESMYDDSFIEGNLREKSLYEIWNDPDAFAYNRRFRPSDLEGKCKGCAYGSICAGGCRSYNYFTHGKLYESLRCVRHTT